jgi:hypothetical protein
MNLNALSPSTPLTPRNPRNTGLLLAAVLSLGLIGSISLRAYAQDSAPPDRPRGEAGRPERADRPQGGPPPRWGSQGGRAQRYSLEQALSERAQLHTIAFNGLAFLTGDFAADTFLPPGKVSDYFGFQYLRDTDAPQGGHSPAFLTRIAFNMLTVLNAAQKEQLIALARRQQSAVRQFALMRLPLIQAFRQNAASGSAPNAAPQAAALNREAVLQHSDQLYELDGEIAYDRAQVMAAVIASLSPQQKEALAPLKFGDSRTWPEVPEPADRRNLPHEVDVALMTYASEMFAWMSGTPEADAYFCPERHGMYFGGFGLKTAPVMGKRDASISTALTGDSGAAFLQALTPEQREHITRLPSVQKETLTEIVTVRRRISAELRRFLHGAPADRNQVLSLSRRYGMLDGELSFQYAQAFAAVASSLSAEQKQTLAALRAQEPGAPKGPFLYASPLSPKDLPSTAEVNAFFGKKSAAVTR